MSTPESDPEVDQFPEMLPPVEPPSAGFIIQLFLIPALIVLAIVGVWLFVNRLARSEQDWRALVADVQSPHEHLRWRGAFGLAQMLQADQEIRSGVPQLTTNPEVAQQLADLLRSELKKGSQEADDLKQQAFLARTLGLFQLPDAVLPTLRVALEPEHDREVRKNALGAIAVIAGRQAEAGRPLEQPELVAQLVTVSTESDPLIRQMAAFDLGLFPSEKSKRRLEALLEDGDLSTQANAAVGLARQDSTAGLPVLEKILKSADERFEPKSDAEFAHFLALKNSVHALEILAPKLDPAEREAVLPLLSPVAKNHRDPKIRADAEKALQLLGKS
jgi:HEAT repeat protein